MKRLIASALCLSFLTPAIALASVNSKGAAYFERFRAGEAIEAIADDFRRTPEEIVEAIRLEAAA